jgi:hypothetical protein
MEQLQNRQRSTFAFFAGSFATFAVKSFFSRGGAKAGAGHQACMPFAVEHWALALRYFGG